MFIFNLFTIKTEHMEGGGAGGFFLSMHPRMSGETGGKVPLPPEIWLSFPDLVLGVSVVPISPPAC